MFFLAIDLGRPIGWPGVGCRKGLLSGSLEVNQNRMAFDEKNVFHAFEPLLVRLHLRVFWNDEVIAFTGKN
jgi:hypothetical protein